MQKPDSPEHCSRCRTGAADGTDNMANANWGSERRRTFYLEGLSSNKQSQGRELLRTENAEEEAV